ncbi:AAA family ATPase [Salinirarus marinus]|uniref:AAA family ATPase n=1 Tax=Salinirarus marinus TaxID=3068310 RepID=UPI003C6C54C7
MIVVVCGPPGAGKTTLATRLHERLTARGFAFRVVHSDAFSSRTYERLYDRVAGTDADWIVDGTFYKREWQTRFRRLDGVRFVHVTASLSTCLARNRTRENAIDERGVHVVYREFDPPEADLTLDTDDLSVEDALDRLERAVLDWTNA